MKVVTIPSLTWTQIATLPFNGCSNTTSNIASPPFCEVVNGRVTFIYCLSNSLTRAVVAYSYDSAGHMCIYQTANFKPNMFTSAYAGGSFQRVGNFFSWKDPYGIVSTFSLPTTWNAGTTYTIPNIQTFNAPSMPCDASAINSQTDYLTNQGIIAYHYTHQFAGQNVATYQAICNLNNQLLKRGQVGFFTNGDPYNQLQLQLPPGVNTLYQCQKNGYQLFHNFDTGTPPQQAYGWVQSQLVGDYSQLICGGTANLMLQGFNQTLNGIQAQGLPVPTGTQAYIGTGATDVPGMFAFPYYTSNNMALVNRDFMLSIGGTNLTPSMVYLLGLCYVSSQNLLVAGASNRNFGTYTGDGKVYVASLNLAQYGLGILPNVQQTGHNGLVNMNRAISIDGSYIT